MNFLIGMLLSVLGGGIQGAFVYPQKLTKGWHWENSWMIFTLTCCLLFPLALAFATTADLLDLYRSVEPRTLWLVFLSGMAWGVGVILFGLGADFLGMALGIAIITALNAAFGTLLPLILLPTRSLGGMSVSLLAVGLSVLVAGVVQIARAGKIRDGEQHGKNSARKVPFRVGVAVCLIAAVFCPATNFAVFFGQPIAEAAAAAGVSVCNVGFAQLLPYFLGGFIVNTAYCVYLFIRNGSLHCYAAPSCGRNILLSIGMSVLFITGMVLYTIATTIYIPQVGTVLGWPLFMAATILAGIVLGLMSGEWKGVSRPAFRALYGGIFLLISAIVVVGFSNLF